MNLFLDSSVLLAACQSQVGASRAIVDRSAANGWLLDSIQYVIDEVESNLQDLRPAGRGAWPRIKACLCVHENVLTFPNPVVFEAAKDRPTLFSGFAYADVLLTLDRADFFDVLGTQFYGLEIIKPGDFLERQRNSGNLR